MLHSAEKVVSVIWDPPLRKARAHLSLLKEETQSSCSVPSHFLTSVCLLCHFCHSFAISWGAEFLSVTNQSCCFWLLRRECWLTLLRNHWMLQSPAMISGLLTGEGYLHSMKFLYSSVATLRFSEEKRGSFSEANSVRQGACEYVDHLPLNHCYCRHTRYNYSPCSDILLLITLPFIGPCGIRGLHSAAAVLAKRAIPLGPFTAISWIICHQRVCDFSKYNR